VAETDFLSELRSFIGTTGAPQVARDPVNVPMIRHWCDAMGETSPLYTDEAAAAAGPFGGIVGPPTMLDVWDKPGLPAKRVDGPQAAVITRLEAQGYTSVVAVNSELEFARFVRPGEVLSGTQALEEVSEEKQTGLGIGHFVTTRTRFSNQDGEHAGDVLFRILKFKPGTGRQAPAPDPGAPPPLDTDPSRRPRPGINRDNQYFWDGTRAHELRVQVCNACGAAYFPPKPRCSNCGSFDLGWKVSSGLGTVYATAVPHHPQAPGFRYPVLVALVELEEGVRIVTNIVGIERRHLEIGLPVEVTWLDSHPALVDGADDSRGPITLPVFRPRPPAPRTTTMRAGEAAVGFELPLTPIALTPTLVVSAALATRDFQDVHHDRDLAQKAGSKDIFMNIHTSVGLTQRWITAAFGPEAIFRNLRVRLGAPNYPGDTMTMTGTVTAADEKTGEVTVGFRGFNSLGDHVVGTADLLLPGGSAYDTFAKAGA
jgi:uncharacterized OB-fold protein/acyl dehydratase